MSNARTARVCTEMDCILLILVVVDVAVVVVVSQLAKRATARKRHDAYYEGELGSAWDDPLTYFSGSLFIRCCGTATVGVL